MTQIAARTQSPSPGQPPSRQSRTSTVVAGCLAVLLAQVAASTPLALSGTFQREFATTGSQLTWITAAFAVAAVALMPVSGAVGDRVGRRRLLQVGALLTLVGTLTVALAGTVEVVWAGQVASGLGAALLYPVSLAMLVAAGPAPQARARSIALWAGSLSIGAALAPAMAGVFADADRWRGSYVVVAVAAAVSVVLSQVVVDSTAPRRRTLDLPGLAILALGLVAILWAATQGTEVGFTRPEIIGALVAGAALLVAFVVLQRSAEQPLLPLTLLADRGYAVVAVATVVGMFAFLATCLTMSIWVGAIQHQSALRLGLLFVLVQAPALVLVPVVARLLRRTSARVLLSTGFALIAVSGIWCSTFDIDDLSWTPFLAPMLVLGVGFALTLGSLTAVAVTAVPPRLAASASATTNLLRGLGFALAPVVVAVVGANRADDQVRAGLAEAIGGSGLEPPYRQIAGGVAQQGGAMALNAMPVVPGATPEMPPVPVPPGLHALAMESLGSAYSLAFLVVGLCAAAVAVLVLVGLRGRPSIADEPVLAEDVPAAG